MKEIKSIFERMKKLDTDTQFNINQLIKSDGFTSRTIQIIETLIETSKSEDKKDK